MNPKIDEILEGKFDRATEALEEGLAELEQAFDGHFREVLNLPLTHFLISVTPGIKTVVVEDDAVYYEIDNLTAAFLGGAAQKLPEAADMLREICATNVFMGAAMPYHLRMSASQFVRGTFPVAKRRGAPVSDNFALKLLARRSAMSIVDGFELDLTRNAARKDGATLSACDAVCMTTRAHGIEISYKQLEEWCTHHRSRSFRERADAVWNHLLDRYLNEIGALKKFDTLSGPLTELARMRS